MGTIKDRNGKALTEAEEIKKRWQEHTKELFKKGLNDLYNYACVVTHVASDILECEVKWALRSITINKASGGDRIPAELFEILKDVAVKSAALNMPANLENSAVTTRLENVGFHSSPKERQWPKNVQLLYNGIHFTCYYSRIMLKILQARLQQYVN